MLELAGIMLKDSKTKHTRGEGMNYKRKKLNLLIKTDFQVWLFWRISGIVCICSVLFACTFYAFVNYAPAGLFAKTIEPRDFQELLAPFVVISIIVSFFSGIVLGVFLPQKIAGPIYRIETDLRAFRDGDLDKRITLRKNDPFGDLAKEINSTISFLATKLS